VSVRLLYGSSLRGELVDVSAVRSGLACGLVCPKCKASLIARKGNIRVHHLAHHRSDTSCVGAVETVTHRLAKDVLREGKRLVLPGLDIIVRRRVGRFQLDPSLPSRGCVFDTVDLEHSIGEVRLDALMTGAVGTIAVEIKVSHEVTPEKIGRLRAAGLVALEIDLSAYSRWDTLRQDIAEAVIHEAPRRWLTIPTIYAGEIAEAWAQGPSVTELPPERAQPYDPDFDIRALLRYDPAQYERNVAEFQSSRFYQPSPTSKPKKSN